MMNSPKIGIQLYSVRESLKKDFKGTLEKVAKLGFQGVEFAFDYGGIRPDELADFLRKNNLQAIGIYEKLPNLCDPKAEVYAQAKALQCRYLTFGAGLKELEENVEGCLERFRTAMAVAADNGLKICYHAHAHEFEKRNGIYYLDLILNAPGLENMDFEADTCWIKKGGEDVIGYMEKYADRIPLLHVKDMAADKQVTELGNGVIDFKAVVAFAKTHNIPWLSYEQDFTNLPGLESATRSIEHLKRCF